MCRDAAAACDAVERCDGAGACPPDGALPAGAACGDATADACTASDTCDAAGVCQPNHAADGTACGTGPTEYRCGGGDGCAARPQARSVVRACLAGACATESAGEWTDLAVCAPNAICVAGPTGASCDTCDTPPSGYCDASNAWNYASGGTCAAGACAYTPTSEPCSGSCSVTGTTAACSGCNDAIMSIAGAPRWSWETGNEGWDMGGDWSRSSRSSSNARTCPYSADFYLFDYSTNESDRNRWTGSYDLTRCSACSVRVEFWVRGYAESTYDGITLECSGNGGSNWTDVGAQVSGSYSSWSRIERTLPSSCITSQSRLAMIFESDFSVEYEGYYVDDFRVFTTTNAPVGYLDGANSAGVSGWTCDADAWSDELAVKLLFYRAGTGTPLARTIRAS